MIGEVAYAVGLRRHWFKQVPCVRKGNMEKQIEYVRTLLMKHAINRKFPQIIEGSLEVKLPTIWTDEKQSREEAERRERLEERRVEEKE